MSASFRAAAEERAGTLSLLAALAEANESGCFELHGTPLTALPNALPITRELKEFDVSGNMLAALPLPPNSSAGAQLKCLAACRASRRRFRAHSRC